MIFKVALLQMLSAGTALDDNVAKGDSFCRQARAIGADIALFPEMWSIGYTGYGRWLEEKAHDVWRAPHLWPPDNPTAEKHDESRAEWQARAIPSDAAFITHFQQLAHDLNMAIILTYLERWSRAPRNTAALIDRHGDIVLTYAKVHTCDFGMEDALTPGDGFHVCRLDTDKGAVSVGVMICYDREFPESARILMLQGAEVILVPNASMLLPIHVEQFRIRAYENAVGMAMTNYAGSDPNGHSVAFDPIAFPLDGGYRDTLLVEAGQEEGIYLAAFDLDQIREHRGRETWGNAFRRPGCYGPIMADDVQPPFVRVNAQGERWDRVKRS
jgi:N-carbamoylputrescine amidase